MEAIMSLPNGFHLADRLQAASFEATGSIDGAAKVTMTDQGIACRLRPPRDWNDKERADYQQGWEDGKALTGSTGYESFEWEHGYRDAAENRMKWHLAYCEDHGDHEGGCGA